MVPDPVITVVAPTTVCTGTTISVTNSGGAGTCTIQWQSSTDNSTFTNITGENTNSYLTPTVSVVMYYRATYTCTGSSNCNSATSGVFTVNPRPIIANQTATICSDVATGFTLPGSSNGVAIGGYNITAINNGGLTASAGTPATGTGLAASVIADDAWTNTGSTSVDVVYTVVPVSRR